MWNTILTLQAGLTTAWVSGDLICGRCHHLAVGARRKAWSESCVPGQVLLTLCIFVPRFLLGPCRRHTAGLSLNSPHSLQKPLLEQWAPGQRTTRVNARKIPQTQPCPRLGMFLGLTSNSKGVEHPKAEADPTALAITSRDPTHSPAMLTVLGLLSFLRCFSHALNT